MFNPGWVSPAKPSTRKAEPLPFSSRASKVRPMPGKQTLIEMWTWWREPPHPHLHHRMEGLGLFKLGFCRPANKRSIYQTLPYPYCRKNKPGVPNGQSYFTEFSLKSQARRSKANWGGGFPLKQHRSQSLITKNTARAPPHWTTQ